MKLCTEHSKTFYHKEYGCMRCLAEKQTRKVVNRYEFAGYRWNKLKFGSVKGMKRRTG